MQVEIMMALEEQFSITLDEEGAEKIVTVQDAADMIEIVKNAQWKKSGWSHCGLYCSSSGGALL